MNTCLFIVNSIRSILSKIFSVIARQSLLFTGDQVKHLFYPSLLCIYTVCSKIVLSLFYLFL